jgi:hypothetical protein
MCFSQLNYFHRFAGKLLVLAVNLHSLYYSEHCLSYFFCLYLSAIQSSGIRLPVPFCKVSKYHRILGALSV